MSTTGNIINRDLLQLFEENVDKIENAFEQGSIVVEINNSSIIIHD